MYLVLFLIISLVLYLLLFYEYIKLPYISTISLVLFVAIGVWYLFKNRRKSLFCPELFFYLFGFIITFFDILVTKVDSHYETLFNSYSGDEFIKSTYLSMISIIAYTLGSEWANIRKDKNKSLRNHYVNLPCNFVTPLSLIVVGIYIYCYVNDVYVYAFKYTVDVGTSVSFGLTLTMITSILAVCSILEFGKYPLNTKNNITFKKFIFGANKLYLINVVIVSLFLLSSGNRNDMMMIAMPLCVLYYFFIKKISNKMFLAYFFIGFLLMIFIGMTRNLEFRGDNVVSNLDVFYLLRDFGAAHIDQNFLIEHTDKWGGTVGLEYGFNTFLSSIPFLGGLLLGNDESKRIDMQNSNNLTTDNLNYGGSGMGTSLFGDLYYSGGIVFVIVYLLILGYFLARVYNKLNRGNSVNVNALVIFCMYFSNMIYILRAAWYNMFRPIGFSLVIIWLLYVYNSKRGYKIMR